MLIHSRLAFCPAWIKIWYFARGLDASGSGRVQMLVDDLLQLADRKKSTLYELLRRGRDAEALRRYSIRKGIVTLYLGSLFRLCDRQELGSWGAVAEMPVEAVKNLRSTACEIQTQALQRVTEYAAKKSLSRQERKYLKLHSVDDIFGRDASPGASVERQSSVKAPVRKSKRIIHRGQNAVFVGEDFIPYGVSQAAIAAALGCCDRTVRNHQINIPKKQLLQAKPAYRHIARAIEHGQLCCGDSETYISEAADGNIYLYERAGASNATRPGGTPVHANRFTNYFGETWLYRCNLYLLDHQLTSMRFARKQYEKLMDRRAVAAEGSPITSVYNLLPGAGITPAGVEGDM